MKRFTFLFIILFSVTSCLNAQVQLWGMTAGGGSSNEGTIFQFTPSPVSFTAEFGFDSSTAMSPYGSLIQASDGNMYGMSQNGGPLNYGAIFKYTPSGTYSALAYFNDSNGSFPRGNLLEASDGNFYGMAQNGGIKNEGTIFQCTPEGVITALVSFDGTNGDFPTGNLIQATDGNLYGMTMFGGSTSADSGVIFKCTTSGVITVLYNFGAANGGYPYGSLIQGSDGNLYGMTMYGGAHDSGTIFKCSLNGTYTILYSFNGASGYYPYGNLIQGFDGNLYGMTKAGGQYGYGTIFKCSTAGNFTPMVSFNSTDGQNPLGSLIQASDSNLYGMSSGGGAYGGGTIFKCTTTGVFSCLVNVHGAIRACDPVQQYGNLIEVKQVEGINAITANDGILLYPNPNNGVFKIENGKLKVKNVEVYNILGEEVYSSQFSVYNSQFSIDISSAVSGIYFAKVATDKGVEIFKFIKK